MKRKRWSLITMVFGLVCFVALSGCGGGDELGETETPIVLEEVFPQPDPDPCEQVSEPCKSDLIPGNFDSVSGQPISSNIVVFSTQNDAVISTVASESGETFLFDWVPGDDSVELIATFPGEPPLSIFQFENGPSSLATANIVATVFLRLNAPSPLSLSLDPRPVEGVSTHSALARQLPEATNVAAVFKQQARQSFNRAGCDELPDFFECSIHGKCCDSHDVCINESCQSFGSGDLRACALQNAKLNACVILTGNVLTCSNDFPPCPLSCMNCHFKVLGCYLSFGEGQSECKFRGICDKPQQCFIKNELLTGKGEVIYDSCECENRGLEPVDKCIRPGGGRHCPFGKSPGSPESGGGICLPF